MPRWYRAAAAKVIAIAWRVVTSTPTYMTYDAPMRTRPFGPDGPAIPVVGVGELRLATAAARGLDVREIERALHQAIDLGILVVDVADEESTERMVGAAVRTLRARDRVIVACRVPWLVPRRDTLVDRMPPRWVQDRVEASLRATRLDVLPLVHLPLLPAWRESTAWPELAGTCARLVREGKVLRWAAIVDAPDEDVGLASEPWLAALTVTLSLCDRAAQPLIEAAAAKHLAVFVRRPLAGGALAGALGPGVKLAPADDRRAIDDATLERIAVRAARLATLVKREPPAARSCKAARAVMESCSRPARVECETVAELALRWAIDHPGVTCVLPRLHHTTHVVDAMAAALAPPLSAELIEAALVLLDN